MLSRRDNKQLVLAALCLVLVLLLAALPTLILSRPIPVILDTDIGDDFDDQMALTYLCSRPDLFTVHAIVVSSFNTTKRALITAYALQSFYSSLTRLHSVPPILMGIAGTDTSSMYQLSFVPQNFSLESYELRGGRIIREGVDYLLSLIRSWDVEREGGPLHVIEIAPASTLGHIVTLLSTTHLANLRVYAMSGSVLKGYGGQAPAQAEYNVVMNITASASVYAHANNYYHADSGAGLVQAPLDSTIYQQWNGKLWQAFLKHNVSTSPFAFTLLNAYEHWYEGGGKTFSQPLPFSPSIGTSIMYDAQAAWSSLNSQPSHKDCAFDDSRLVYQCLQISVNKTGFTNIDVLQGTNVSAAVGFKTSDPYLSALAIGADILSSIANSTLNYNDAELVVS